VRGIGGDVNEPTEQELIEKISVERFPELVAEMLAWANVRPDRVDDFKQSMIYAFLAGFTAGKKAKSVIYDLETCEIDLFDYDPLADDSHEAVKISGERGH
jgi:hypothetical protein